MRTSLPCSVGLILGVVALAVTGCTEDVDSADIRTSGMYPEFQAVSDGSGTQVRARIKIDGNASNTFVDVKDEDSLVATVGKETKTLKEVADEEYGADFSEDAGGTVIKIALDRGEADDGAPNSKATLPEPFALKLDSAQIVRRGDPIKFSWAPANEPGTMKWDLDSTCTFIADGSAGDDGSFTIDGKDHKQVGDDDGEECTVTLTVDRVLTGTVDEAYEDGEFTAIQRRTVTFTSVGPDAEIDEPMKPADNDGGTKPADETKPDAAVPADEPLPDAGADAGK